MRWPVGPARGSVAASSIAAASSRRRATSGPGSWVASRSSAVRCSAGAAAVRARGAMTASLAGGRPGGEHLAKRDLVLVGHPLRREPLERPLPDQVAVQLADLLDGERRLLHVVDDEAG